ETYDGGSADMFNMAVMGLRLAQRANGVSQLHGVVSREMFDGLWPGFDDAEVPIASITNGVHGPTWVDRQVVELARTHTAAGDLDTQESWEALAAVPRDAMWATKRELRLQLVEEARRLTRDSWLERGASPAELGWVDDVLDPDVLTIGFARRVPTYKRLTLMLRDPERLKSLLLDPARPVQLVIAGKSHPADETGKQLIQQLVRFADDPEVRHRIVFLPDYDIAMALRLYPGCDVWLNNPLRPFEACGTSGMKAALNGALNLSILDGWWDEWFDGENGWAIPTADGVDDPDRRDDIEAAALYDLVEQQVAPRFYDRDGAGLPQNWLSMVLHTMSTLGPKVRANRMVRDYTERLYVPAARSGWAMAADSHRGAKDLAAYRHRVAEAWDDVRVDHVESAGVGDSPQLGETLRITAFVSLGTLGPDDVDVQVVYGRTNHHGDEL
ncbi:MAG: alpha-glucan family phosphorylase, partial [Phycicoccus sp.]